MEAAGPGSRSVPWAHAHLAHCAPQAPEDRRLLCLPVGPIAGTAPGRAASAGGLAWLAGHAQAQHDVPVLPRGLHGNCGHKEGDGPAEVPAPKVRAAAVTAGGGQTMDRPGAWPPGGGALSVSFLTCFPPRLGPGAHVPPSLPTKPSPDLRCSPSAPLHHLPGLSPFHSTRTPNAGSTYPACL